MSGLSGALCRGRGELFTSTDLADHHEAAAICAQCPVTAACELQRAADTAAHGGVCGTWAGQLFGADGRKHRSLPREHGTEKGYYQHRNRKEAACDKCLEAMRFGTWFRRRYGAKV